MTSLARVILALLVLVAGATAPARAEPAIEVSGEALDQASVDKVLAAFWKACPRLKSAMIDVSVIRIKSGEEYAEHRLQRGWATNVHIAITLSGKLAVLPETTPRAGVVAGQTLHYDVGGGSTPGMLGQKIVSQELCGMPVVEGADSFKPVPDFSILDPLKR